MTLCTYEGLDVPPRSQWDKDDHFKPYHTTTMSARTCADDMSDDAAHSSSPQEKGATRLDDDDALDDSSSSYCTALCSLDSEDSEDEVVFTEPLCEDASSESSHSEASETSKISAVTYVPSQGCKTKEGLQPVEETKITVMNLNLTNIHSLVAVHNSAPKMPWDYFRGESLPQTDTKPFHGVRNVQRNTDTHQAQRNGVKQREDSSTSQRRSVKSHYKLDGGKSIRGILKRGEEEDQGTGAGEEQAKPSLKAENRNLPANCTSTPKVQKPGTLPRFYSEHILATGNRHPSPNLPLSRCLQKQSRPAVCLSALLPQTPSSSSREHSAAAGSIEEPFGMAETTTHARALASSDPKSSCSEANYMDVLNYSPSAWSRDGDPRGCSTDVVSSMLPVMQTTPHDASACSETGSFECIDVSSENHEGNTRNAKTVPKRQIQLKKREDSEAGVNDALPEVPPSPRRPRELLRRQHSTPAAFHRGSHGSECSSGQTERKQKFQKSSSLDETGGKTKKASCIIKTVILKRMQHEQNLGTLDVTEQDFGQLKASDDDISSSSAKEVSTESDQESLPAPHLSSANLFQSPALLEPQTTRSTIREHTGVSSKTQPKLITKHGFNPLFCALGRIQMRDSDETTPVRDNKDERLGLCEDSCLTGLSTEEKTRARDSAGAVGRPASVKTTPEECCPTQDTQRQQVLSFTEKQENEAEENDGTPFPPSTASMSHSLKKSTLVKVKPRCPVSNPVKEPELHSEEPTRPGQSGNVHVHNLGKSKGIAPVHVVRDIRSLVKNIYTQSFRGPGEAAQGLKSKGEKPYVQKKTSSALDRVKLFSSRGKSHDDLPHARLPKINPISAPMTDGCALSKPQEEHVTGQAGVQGGNVNMTQANRKGTPPPTKHDLSNKLAKEEQSADSNRSHEKPRNPAEHQGRPQETRLQHWTSVDAESPDHPDSTKPSNETCLPTKHVHQTPCRPPGSQNSDVGPPSACILTVAPTPVFPTYLYTPSPLGYQTLPPNIGTASYVQGPVFMPTPAHHQTDGSAPLAQALSPEAILLARPCMVDGFSVHQGSSKETNNAATLKMPTPDTPRCRTFFTTLGAESTPGGGAMLIPETVGGPAAPTPRHVLLDPETGRCFFVDVPPVPRRKMLFDPETCQYVEVLLPQQTFSTPVLTPSCAIPYPSLHVPAVYAPCCPPFIQAHPQVLKPPGP